MPLDIGIGILLSFFAHLLFHVPLSLPLVIGGIVAALLPDIDIVTKLFGRWRHREYTHYPLLYVPILIVCSFILSPMYLFIFTLGIYIHLIHDTIGIGWGIQWLWPFSRRHFLVFPERSRRAILGTFVSWTPKQDHEIRTRTYQGATGHWLRDFYFRPNFLAYIEYGVLLVALITLGIEIW